MQLVFTSHLFMQCSRVFMPLTSANVAALPTEFCFGCNLAKLFKAIWTSMSCGMRSPTPQLLKLSCVAERESWSVRWWSAYILPFCGLSSPSLFPLTPSAIFLICPEPQRHPLYHLMHPHPSYTPHLSLISRPHAYLSLFSLLSSFSLNLLTPLLTAFCLSILATPLISSTFPWQNQGWESNDLLFCLHLLSELVLWKKALSTKAFIPSRGLSCLVHTGKDFGLTGNLGAHGKMWVTSGLNSLSDVSSRWAHSVIRYYRHMLTIKL